jgi:DNA-binding MarR family transcriptional regulator
LYSSSIESRRYSRGVSSPPSSAGPGAAFLLAQVGARAAAAFAERIAPLGLDPRQAGVLRLLGQSPGLSQRELADALGLHATRLVALIDDLEGHDLVVRTRDPSDRRNYSLALAPAGTAKLAELSTVAREHEQAITAGLTAAERRDLVKALRRIADAQGLRPGIHPGYGKNPRGGRARRDKAD